MKLIDTALDFIFPPTCGICDKLGEGYICKKCYKEIEKYLYDNNSNKTNLEKRKNKNSKIKSFDTSLENNIFYLLQYKDIVREKMIQYKFNDKSYLYKMFCEIIIKNKNACEFLKSYDIIIPVPMNKKKKRIRGYNQTELIAKELSKYFNMQIDTKNLVKEKNTPMQSSLGKSERTKNVKNVYKVLYPEKIKGKKVLILDDIYTTGATVNECRKILQNEKVGKVGVFIVAKD